MSVQVPTSASRVERRSIDYVPIAERHGKVWHLWSIWFMGDAHFASIAVGAIGIALGANLIWTAIAVAAGSAFGTFFMAFHSTQGPQMGIPQMLQSRPQFGYIGALLIWIVALVCYIGFNGFNEIVVASTINHFVTVPNWICYIGYAVVTLGLAVIGYDLIHRATHWLGLIVMATLAVFTIGIIAVNPFTPAQLDLANFHAAPFFVQFFSAAVYQLGWAIYVSDYSRYLPPKVSVKSSFAWTYGGAFLGGTWMMLVGTVVAGLFPKGEIVDTVVQAGDLVFVGFGAALLIITIAALIPMGTMNFYGAGLTLLSAVSSVKKIKPTFRKRAASTLVIALIATVIAFASGESKSLVEWFGNFLIILTYLFTPWTAINLIDFYVVRHAHYSIREIFNPRGMYGRWNWRGLTAYFVGFACMLPFAAIGDLKGPVARALGGVDVSMIVGLLVAGGLYWLLCRGLDLDAERRRVAIADAGLEQGGLAS
ncbi:MAG TPA: cytosine permease [Nevskiaceae bacterium]|nr:cytosine permease [Nevskiaceae bacterium]